MADEFFGPALPPKTTDETENPSRKPHQKRKHSESSSSDSGSSSSSSSSSDSGSHKRRRLSNEDFSRSVPVVLKRYGAPDRPNADSSVNSFIGPVIPAELLSNKEEEFDGQEWGPKPPADDISEIESTVDEIERRAERMKNKLLNKDNETPSNAKPERESWMMELPPVRTGNFALVARNFSMAVPSANKDRSSWTDTPADRARKEQDLLSGKLPAPEKISHESRQLAQRDSKYAQQVEEYNKSKKREKSLLELHGEKKSKDHKKKHKKEKHKDKKKKKEKGKDKEKEKDKKKEKAPERRPFDRDVDLKVCRMDDAQRQAIIKRSQQLSGRFGHGSSTGKFL